MKYKLSTDIIWEDTGMIRLHNFPPSGMTYSYITKVYREYRREKLGWSEVEGEAIYLHNLSTDKNALAVILGHAQNALAQLLVGTKYEPILNGKEIKDETTLFD